MSEAASILIVDDEAATCSILSAMLSLADYEVHTACTPQEARHILAERPIELMLLDLHLGEHDGLSLLREIRQDWPELAIVIITGYGSLDSAIEALHQETSDYLIKPLAGDELRRRVGEVLQQQRAYRRRRARLQAIYERLQWLLEQRAARPPATPRPPTPLPVLEPGAGLKLDRERGTAWLNGQALNLTPAEFGILRELIDQPGLVISCATLAWVINGLSLDEEQARQVIRPHISRLRHKIEPDPRHPLHIELVRGFGYRWNSEGAEPEAV